MTKKDLSIREGIHGTFFYHLAKDGVPLCGNENTMVTRVPLSCWNVKTHLNERYCKECNIIFEEMK